jgi:hypothetical protein
MWTGFFWQRSGSLPASYEGGNETSVSTGRKYFTTEKF